MQICNDKSWASFLEACSKYSDINLKHLKKECSTFDELKNFDREYRKVPDKIKSKYEREELFTVSNNHDEYGDTLLHIVNFDETIKIDDSIYKQAFNHVDLLLEDVKCLVDRAKLLRDKIINLNMVGDILNQAYEQVLLLSNIECVFRNKFLKTSNSKVNFYHFVNYLIVESNEAITKLEKQLEENMNNDNIEKQNEEIEQNDTFPSPPPPPFFVFDTDEESEEFYEEAEKLTGLPIDVLKSMPKIKYDTLDDLCRKTGLSVREIQKQGGIIPVPKCKHSGPQKGMVLSDNPTTMGQIPSKPANTGTLVCNSCNTPNPYAEPNQPDGTYVCWECSNF